MPIIKSAKKKLKQDIKRTVRNASQKAAFVKFIKEARKKKNSSLNKIFSTIDKAASRKIIHKNKAARLKGQFAKLLGTKKQTKKAKAQ